MPAFTATAPELVATVIFAIAVLHTFSTKFFAKLAHLQPGHAGLWHLLAEVEVVFGFWAFILIVALFILSGPQMAVGYLDGRNFTEPMFVFVIMAIAASRPILTTVVGVVRLLAAAVPVHRAVAMFFVILSIVPMLGSFITEPAAMTLAALMLRENFFQYQLSNRLKYGALGVLFVNVSIGGTLTHFAAPPVLMVAGKWGWDTLYMFSHFGWKASAAVVFNAVVFTWFFRKELAERGHVHGESGAMKVPPVVAAIHILFLAGVVALAHHPAAFMGLFLFFIGYTEAYKVHQDRLLLREGLMVAFFLAGLVVLGGLQQWWLQQSLVGVEPTLLYFLATALTAVTDNAALTYLGSLVEGVTPEFKYALVAGAVTGGGLTIIANAPNPAGATILKSSFPEETISAFGLFLAALPPTCVAILAFQIL